MQASGITLVSQSVCVGGLLFAAEVSPPFPSAQITPPFSSAQISLPHRNPHSLELLQSPSPAGNTFFVSSR
jgi:hypothetical protein